MSDRPEIPQGLQRDMEWVVRNVAARIKPELIIASAIAAKDKLDALAQPPDPAWKVADDVLACFNLTGHARLEVAGIVTEHYAEREKAVKEFLRVHQELTVPFREAHHRGSETTDCPACMAAANVRRLFGWDK